MRSIAERLAYNRAYSPSLNSNLFDEDDQLITGVRDKILEIVDAFLEYAQVENIKVADIRLVGSNASYNYNEHSDVDVHIVTNLSKIADPETIARLYFDATKKNFKDSYDITIKGMDVEIYVEDINTSAQSNGVYSVTKDEWIRHPEPIEDPSEDDIAEAEEIEEEIINSIKNAKDIDDLEEIIDDLYLMRKDALASKGETAPANLAFKSLRNKGILDKVKDTMRSELSKELSLESKSIRESFMIRKLRENLKDTIQLDSVPELIEFLMNLELDTGDDYIISTKSDYNCYIFYDYKNKVHNLLLTHGLDDLYDKRSSDANHLLQGAIKALREQ